MRMGIGLGIGINRSNYAQGIFNAYSARVVADGGVVESGTCVDAVSSLLQSASLLLIPSGYKGGKLYAEIPTNGNGDLTWTRGSDAFRTNASGLIQRVPWNLLSYSETFDNAIWGKQRTTISANVTSSPNGTLTADKLVETNVNGTHIIFTNISQPSTPRKNQTYSFYAKQGERNWIATSGDMGTTYFNLANGQVGTVTTSTFWFSGITASMENVGDGWYRCVLSGFGFIEYNLGIKLATADGTDSYTGDGTSGAFIWGAQLVEGTTAQTYLPTTDRLNFPRLSYMYGSCPSALLEPQRTNLFLWSSAFTNGVWLSGGGGTGVYTDNFATSPDGTQNAARWTAAGTGYQTRQNVATINTTATLSVWMRTNSGTKSVSLFINDGISGVSTITVTTTWQRFTVTAAIGGTLSGGGRCGWYNNSILTNTDYIEIFGAQYEVGAYTTTYIPTTSATATRVADSFSRNNIYTNGLISASGGTWFVELRNNIVYTRDNVNRFGIGDTTALTTNSFYFISDLTGRLLLFKSVGGTATRIYDTTTTTTKIAIKWNGATADVFANGTKVVSATAFTATALQELIGSVGVPQFIQQMALFPTPLSDTDCTTLTTL